jgi:integrase
MKWLRGIRWSEIDDKLILRHVTSKKLKLVEPDLKLCPMVIEELQRIYPSLVVSDAVFDDDDLVQEMTVDRSVLPTSGPIIVFEETARPYETHRFRRLWRALATTASIPKNVQNRDSRAGAATEATGFGADLHDTQHLLAHSDIATTQIYSRGKAEKATKAQRARVVGRKRAASPL